MRDVRVSESARADILNVLETSFAGWGTEGRARYTALLLAAMRTIAATPDGPTTRARADLGTGVRGFHLRHARGDHGVRSPVHVLYYRVVDPDRVEIVAVLHERMDPARHFDEPRKAARRTRRAPRR